ncbi:MAG: terminase TerL endonuclease subunit [Actinomycetota bacterium]
MARRPSLTALRKRAAAQGWARWIRGEADEKATLEGCRFDAGLAEHAAGFFPRYLRHSKGEWAGQPFDLLDWQREDLIMPLFGWVREDGSRRFRKAYVELPKKNGKSTIASGIGLYMLVGDGEPGAEIYSVATDKDQASIVHGEAINMVDASPELSQVLRLNRTTRNIHYDDARSWYRALSAEPRSKEGLNAHAMIMDEFHVWRGRELYDALRWAFAARRQPLLFVITTAGDDLESVCGQEHDYARGILDGTIDDSRFFAYIRSASREDDLDDPAVWHRSNPSLGVTIPVDDFRRDWQEAQKSTASRVAFERYRFNIWGGSTTPWLDYQAWVDGAGEYGPDDLAGWECFGGLDLAKTRDLTAFSLVFPDEDAYWLLAWHWIPEEVAFDPRQVNPYRQWVEEGWLRTTPGNVADHAAIRAEIAAIVHGHGFVLRDYGYDPWEAESTTQQLEQDHGFPRVKFTQTIGNFAEPTAEFERLVLSGRMRHDGNPLLGWQVRNVTVYTDANGNIRPVKPQAGNHRKIDGIVSSIMALGRALAHAEKPSAYEERGLRCV